MLMFTSCLPQNVSEENEGSPSENKYTTLNYSYMKGVWLSQYDLQNVCTDNGRQREKEDFAARMGRIFDNIKEMGFNTVIIQVRPFGDSFYPSEYYPMSSYAVGAYGGVGDYDAFSIALQLAHERGLSVHAWINPLRAMLANEVMGIDDKYAVKRWYESKSERVKDVSGRLYLNPAYPEVRELICDGVREIVHKYPVDGVHIDDYFYPTTDSGFDLSAYTAYLADGGNKDQDDFRRMQIDLLVSGIYSTVKGENESVLFGVSPSGVMRNNYEKLYADVALWCAENGYLDYVCPQVYFGFEHSTYPFNNVCDEFAALIRADGVRLIIGMTLGKAAAEYDPYAGEGKYEWRDSKGVLRRSFLYTLSMPECSGVCFFSYQYFYDPVSGRENPATADEREGLLPLIKNKISK